MRVRGVDASAAARILRTRGLLLLLPLPPAPPLLLLPLLPELSS
jgi:hypothetical protein